MDTIVKAQSIGVLVIQYFATIKYNTSGIINRVLYFICMWIIKRV